jgi:hypothetical protein
VQQIAAVPLRLSTDPIHVPYRAVHSICA